MAQINFTIPDGQIQRIVDAFALVYRYDPVLHGQTKAQFAKGKIRDYIKEIVVRAESLEAQRVALREVQDSIDLIDIS